MDSGPRPVTEPGLRRAGPRGLNTPRGRPPSQAAVSRTLRKARPCHGTNPRGLTGTLAQQPERTSRGIAARAEPVSLLVSTRSSTEPRAGGGKGQAGTGSLSGGATGLRRELGSRGPAARASANGCADRRCTRSAGIGAHPDLPLGGAVVLRRIGIKSRKMCSHPQGAMQI